MNTITTLFRTTMLLAALFVSASTLRADVPGKPVELSAKVVNSDDGSFVKLSWMTNREGGTPESFEVYMAQGQTEDMALFTKIDTVQAEPNVLTYGYLTSRMEPGTYTFYVLAVNADGNSLRSIIRVVTIGKAEDHKPSITIKAPRSADGMVDKEWRFEVKIEKEGDFNAITFSLDGEPDGLSINATSGVMSWPHPTEGRHVFVVIVTGTLPNGETITTKQEFVIEVGKPEPKPCTEISGTVTDKDGHAANGVVTVWMVKPDNNQNDTWMPIQKVETRDGRYGVGVIAGTYKLRFESHAFKAEWYQDAYELVDAASIVVTCDPPHIEANFVVDRLPEPVMRVASGRVFDAESGEGLINALVVFTPAKANPAAGMANEVRAETNADGVYEVRLIEGVTYFATANARMPGHVKNLYRQEWWENTNDASLAKGITLTADQDAIDFPMDVREDYDNGLNGKLVDNESRTAVPGKVIAYFLGGDKREPNKRFAETVTTDSSGYFEFSNMEPGKYLLFGMPDERPWVPGWYVDNEPSVDSWKHSTAITVGTTTTTGDLLIRLRQVNKENGRGRVSGHCYDAHGGIITKSSGNVQGAIPVPGALVIATDPNNGIVDFAFADADGMYTLDVMPVGQFTISADRIWFDPATSPVELTDQSLDVVSDFGMNQAVTSVEVPSNMIGKNINLYPNPANTSASLVFTTTEGTTSVRVLDMTGSVLTNMTVPVNAGVSTITIPTASLASGMVMVHITNGTTSFALPLQIVR